MSTFRNKSWYFSTVMVVILACLTAILAFFGYLILQSVFVVRVYRLGQDGWILLGSEILIFLVLGWLTLMLLTRYFWHKSFLKIDQNGIEICYLNNSWQSVNQNFKWSEIALIGDQLGKVQYELYLSLKSQDDLKSEKIFIPFELWQSTFRMIKIRAAVDRYCANTNFKILAKAALIFEDVLLIIFLIFIFSLATYVGLAQLTGQSCNCF